MWQKKPINSEIYKTFENKTFFASCRKIDDTHITTGDVISVKSAAEKMRKKFSKIQ